MTTIRLMEMAAVLSAPYNLSIFVKEHPRVATPAFSTASSAWTTSPVQHATHLHSGILQMLLVKPTAQLFRTAPNVRSELDFLETLLSVLHVQAGILLILVQIHANLYAGMEF